MNVAQRIVFRHLMRLMAQDIMVEDAKLNEISKEIPLNETNNNPPDNSPCNSETLKINKEHDDAT